MEAVVRKNIGDIIGDLELDFSGVSVRNSGVDGRGAYAARNLQAGEFVAPLTGAVIPAKVANDPDYNLMALQIDDDWWLEERGYPDDFINHSCNQNLKFSEQGNSFVAIRNIVEGEELFFDYATTLYDGGWRMPCHCNSVNCRKHIQGFQDLDSVLQNQLLKNCLPYIRKKHE